MKKPIVIFIGIFVVIFTVVLSIWYLVSINNDKSKNGAINQNSLSSDFLTTPTIPPTVNGILPSISVSPTPIQTPSLQKIKSGSFINLDALHGGSGEVEVIKKDNRYFLKFNTNFIVKDGPDLYVYLSSEQKYGGVYGGVETTKTLNLGKLKQQSGEQIYEITVEEYNKYNHAVVIWCKAFAAQFTRAELK